MAYNNIRSIPPYPTNLEERRAAGLQTYGLIVNSALDRGIRSQAVTIAQTPDANGRIVKRTYNFPNGKIEDLFFYPTDPTGEAILEIRGAYSDLTGMILPDGGSVYDIGLDGRYGSIRTIAYTRKANQAPTQVIVTNVDGTVFTDTFAYNAVGDTEPNLITRGTPAIPLIKYSMALSGISGSANNPVTLTFTFPSAHPACTIVPTAYGGGGSFATTSIPVAANAPSASVTFTPTTNNVTYAFSAANDAGLGDPSYQTYSTTTTVSGGGGGGGGGTSPTYATSYLVSASAAPYSLNTPIVLTFTAQGGSFAPSTTISSSVTAPATGTFGAVTFAPDRLTATANFTPTSTGSAVLSFSTNTPGLTNPANFTIAGISAGTFTWTTYNGATANGGILSIPPTGTDNNISGGSTVIPASITDIQIPLTGGYNVWGDGNTNFYFSTSVGASTPPNNTAYDMRFGFSYDSIRVVKFNGSDYTDLNYNWLSNPTTALSILKVGNNAKLRGKDNNGVWNDIYTWTDGFINLASNLKLTVVHIKGVNNVNATVVVDPTLF